VALLAFETGASVWLSAGGFWSAGQRLSCVPQVSRSRAPR
jgi:hypothetical protein